MLKAWIEAGAPASAVKAAARRPFVSVKDVLTAVRNHLQDADVEDRPYLRYFTLAHLPDNSAVDEARLGRARAALSKVLNGMHWKAAVVLPQPVDRDGTVFAIDLRDLDWDKKDHEREDRWKVMMRHDPYGLAHEDPNDLAVKRLDDDVFQRARWTPILMRADWFVTRASRPPLYEQVLRLPANARQLEEKLGVDVVKNFQRNRLARAGFARSFVSSQNRLVERHDALYGAYWKSYDFKKGAEKGNLFQLPLGPELGPRLRAKDPYRDVRFRHDGGEMIFHLPNGMQGYYLSDGNDGYIAKGPVDVVSDPNMRSGTAEIVNGLSCTCCHDKGMIDSVLDDVRKGNAVFGDALRKVKKLYPPREQMLKLVEQDRDRFLSSLERAMRPYLAGEDRGKKAEDVPEPITDLLVKYYNPDVTLATAAYELGLASPDELKAAIQASESLRELGLRPLAEGGGLKRELWDNGDQLENPNANGQSLFHRTARALGLGSRRVPLR